MKILRNLLAKIGKIYALGKLECKHLKWKKENLILACVIVNIFLCNML